MVVMGALACGGLDGELAGVDAPRDRILDAADEEAIQRYLAPLPNVAMSPANPLTEEKVALGRALFLETALSNPLVGDGARVSCNTCHLLDQYGIDGLDRSIGILGEKVPVNAPTVYNAALHFRQFWDGRAETVEEQALGPITAPPEMGFTDTPADRAQVMAQLVEADAGYPGRFSRAFTEDGETFTFANIGRAIGAFERTLITPGRVDRFLGGEATLSDRELRGLKLFLNAGGVGCVSCHDGSPLGGGQFRDLGGIPEAADSSAELAYADLPSPLKVPSLRNITETGPYFHNGSVETLEEAVRLMATYQLGVAFSPDEMSDLLAFLGALTGALP